MGRYIVNETMHNFDKIKIDDIDFIKNDLSLYVVNVNKTCDNDINKYYKFIKMALRKGNRVILLSKNDGNTSFRTLANLMLSYDAYDIYKMPGEKILTADYLDKLINHKPTFNEVETYVGGDVAAYASLDTLMMGIESLTEDGNVEALEKFMDNHSISLDSLTSTLNYMKGICNNVNTKAQVEQIDELSKKIEEQEAKLKTQKAELAKMNKSNEELQEMLSNIKTENEKLKSTNRELQNDHDGLGGFTIKSYKTVNMGLLKCTTKIVIYIKEISYVRYVNSLVHNIMFLLKSKGAKAKLLIYDDNPGFANIYNGFTVVTGDVYKNSKTTILGKSSFILVVEPIQNLLEDILQSEENLDVVIVYDRMKNTEDLVKGNLVTKFFVINSTSDYNNMQGNLKIEKTSNIIMPSNSSMVNNKNIVNDPLDIGTIPGYSGMTDVAKTAKYFRLLTSKNKLLITEIFKRSKVDKIMSI